MEGKILISSSWCRVRPHHKLTDQSESISHDLDPFWSAETLFNAISTKICSHLLFTFFNRKSSCCKHFLLSRLWYRTEIVSIPTHILHELESFILDFVWAGKKHEVNKQLMSANLDQGGLKLVNIQIRLVHKE